MRLSVIVLVSSVYVLYCQCCTTTLKDDSWHIYLDLALHTSFYTTPVTQLTCLNRLLSRLMKMVKWCDPDDFSMHMSSYSKYRKFIPCGTVGISQSIMRYERQIHTLYILVPHQYGMNITFIKFEMQTINDCHGTFVKVYSFHHRDRKSVV